MNKIPACFFIVLLLAGAVDTQAQNLRKKFSIGVGLEAGLPEADAKDSYTFTAGITARFSYRLGHGFATFTTGGIGYAPKTDDINLQAALQIPFEAGYKYIFGRHIFVMGEAGYSDIRAYYKDMTGKLQSTNHGGFTYAPTLGVQFGTLELAVRYETVRTNGLDIARAGFRLGFKF